MQPPEHRYGHKFQAAITSSLLSLLTSVVLHKLAVIFVAVAAPVHEESVESGVQHHSSLSGGHTGVGAGVATVGVGVGIGVDGGK